MEVMVFTTKNVVLSLDGNKFDFYQWSPDESEILVREHVATVEDPGYYKGKLAKINVLSKEKVTLTKVYRDLFTADWSEANNIVFCANQNIYTVDNYGKHLRKIFKGGNFPNVAASDQKIIFVRNKKGVPVYEIGLDGKNLKLLEQTTFAEPK